MAAYQEDLISLDDLRRRMPDVRKREQAIRTGRWRPSRASLPITRRIYVWQRQ
jgi:hypothetical protein